MGLRLVRPYTDSDDENVAILPWYDHSYKGHVIHVDEDIRTSAVTEKYTRDGGDISHLIVTSWHSWSCVYNEALPIPSNGDAIAEIRVSVDGVPGDAFKVCLRVGTPCFTEGWVVEPNGEHVLRFERTLGGIHFPLLSIPFTNVCIEIDGALGLQRRVHIGVLYESIPCDCVRNILRSSPTWVTLGDRKAPTTDTLYCTHGGMSRFSPYNRGGPYVCVDDKPIFSGDYVNNTQRLYDVFGDHAVVWLPPEMWWVILEYTEPETTNYPTLLNRVHEERVVYPRLVEQLKTEIRRRTTYDIRRLIQLVRTERSPWKIYTPSGARWTLAEVMQYVVEVMRCTDGQQRL